MHVNVMNTECSQDRESHMSICHTYDYYHSEVCNVQSEV